MLRFLPDECYLLEKYLYIDKNYFMILSENISVGWARKTKTLNVDFIHKKVGRETIGLIWLALCFLSFPVLLFFLKTIQIEILR